MARRRWLCRLSPNLGEKIWQEWPWTVDVSSTPMTRWILITDENGFVCRNMSSAYFTINLQNFQLCMYLQAYSKDSKPSKVGFMQYACGHQDIQQSWWCPSDISKFAIVLSDALPVEVQHTGTFFQASLVYQTNNLLNCISTYVVQWIQNGVIINWFSFTASKCSAPITIQWMCMIITSQYLSLSSHHIIQ